jgi:hypothetical protein
MKIAGVVCVHEISQRKDNRELSKVLDSLCKKGAAENLILVTTKWKEGLEKHEEEFKRTRWRNLLSAGCHIARFNKTYSSAWDVVDTLLRQRPIDHDEFRSAFYGGTVLPKRPSGNFFKRIFGSLFVSLSPIICCVHPTESRPSEFHR